MADGFSSPGFVPEDYVTQTWLTEKLILRVRVQFSAGRVSFSLLLSFATSIPSITNLDYLCHTCCMHRFSAGCTCATAVRCCISQPQAKERQQWRKEGSDQGISFAAPPSLSPPHVVSSVCTAFVCLTSIYLSVKSMLSNVFGVLLELPPHSLLIDVVLAPSCSNHVRSLRASPSASDCTTLTSAATALHAFKTFLRSRIFAS